MLWSQYSAIFANFRRKNWLAFFSKTNVMIQFLHNLALFWAKNAYFFAKFFGKKYFKNHNIGPRWNVALKTVPIESTSGTEIGKLPM
jgi:hypothetical protein